MVLKFEMWDKAGEFAQTMLEGEFYFISNARMRVSQGGYSEGKIVEPKITKLDETEPDSNPHLKLLLEYVHTVDWLNLID